MGRIVPLCPGTSVFAPLSQLWGSDVPVLV